MEEFRYVDKIIHTNLFFHNLLILYLFDIFYVLLYSQ